MYIMFNLTKSIHPWFKPTSRRLISVKASSYSEGYSTMKKDQQKKIVHSGGFKRDHDDSDFELNIKKKKSFYDCENEKWFPEQLNSGENYKDKIVDDRGDGNKLFTYKYGSSIWDPEKYKSKFTSYPSNIVVPLNEKK